MDLVNKHSGQRSFFSAVPHYTVHVPHAAGADWFEKYRKLPRGQCCKDDDYLPAAKISNGKEIRSWRLQYVAMLEKVDEGLGAIVDALKKTGQLKDTYIIFTSDNDAELTPNETL